MATWKGPKHDRWLQLGVLIGRLKEDDLSGIRVEPIVEDNEIARYSVCFEFDVKVIEKLPENAQIALQRLTM